MYYYKNLLFSRKKCFQSYLKFPKKVTTKTRQILISKCLPKFLLFNFSIVQVQNLLFFSDFGVVFSKNLKICKPLPSLGTNHQNS